MKNAVLYIILFCNFLLSCSGDDDNVTNDSPESIKAVLLDGSWFVSYFWDSDHDETDEFSNYTFRFYSNGNLEATTGSIVITGSWDLEDDRGTELDIVFSTGDKFEDELSEDWDIIEQTKDEIRLEHISGGNGGADYLTFAKN